MCNADLYVGLPSLSQNCNETHWACCPLRPSRAVRSEYPSSMKSNMRHCLNLKTLAARVSVKCTRISRRTVPSGAQGTFTVITCSLCQQNKIYCSRKIIWRILNPTEHYSIASLLPLDRTAPSRTLLETIYCSLSSRHLSQINRIKIRANHGSLVPRLFRLEGDAQHSRVGEGQRSRSLVTDQKDRGLWGREWLLREVWTP